MTIPTIADTTIARIKMLAKTTRMVSQVSSLDTLIGKENCYFTSIEIDI